MKLYFPSHDPIMWQCLGFYMFKSPRRLQMEFSTFPKVGLGFLLVILCYKICHTYISPCFLRDSPSPSLASGLPASPSQSVFSFLFIEPTGGTCPTVLMCFLLNYPHARFLFHHSSLSFLYLYSLLCAWQCFLLFHLLLQGASSPLVVTVISSLGAPFWL